jgi:hypothetical protein
MEKQSILYACSKPTKMNYVFFGNYRDKTGRYHEYIDINGMEHRGFSLTQPTLALDVTQEAHKLLDEFLEEHPLVKNKSWTRTNVREKQNKETTEVLNSAQAIIEAAKMNTQEVYDFAKLAGLGKNSNVDVLRAKIITLAQNDAKKFMKIHFDPEKSYRTFIVDALVSKKLSYENATFMYGKEAIGLSEEQVIVWLKDNKDIYAILRQELRGGESSVEQRKPIEEKSYHTKEVKTEARSEKIKKQTKQKIN